MTPTPKAMEDDVAGIDLGEGRRLLAEATPGEWQIASSEGGIYGFRALTRGLPQINIKDPAYADLIVWLVNNAHALIEAAERAEAAELAYHEAAIERDVAGFTGSVAECIKYLDHELSQERARSERYREALEKIERMKVPTNSPMGCVVARDMRALASAALSEGPTPLRGPIPGSPLEQLIAEVCKPDDEETRY